MKIAGENKMFGLGRKTEEKNISSMEEALGIVKKARASGTIDRNGVRIKSNFKFSEEEKNNLELFIQRYFKSEESSYHCKGKHLVRESKGLTKHSLSLDYFNQVHTEVVPMNIGFAFAGIGSGSKSDNIVPDTQTNIIRKAIIEFYVK